MMPRVDGMQKPSPIRLLALRLLLVHIKTALTSPAMIAVKRLINYEPKRKSRTAVQ